MFDIFRDLIGRFVVIYLDNILIYSKRRADHDSHVRAVLDVLRKQHLYVNPLKCSFGVTTIDFLGYIVSRDGLSMDPAKTEIIQQWRPPANIKQV